MYVIHVDGKEDRIITAAEVSKEEMFDMLGVLFDRYQHLAETLADVAALLLLEMGATDEPAQDTVNRAVKRVYTYLQQMQELTQQVRDTRDRGTFLNSPE